MDEQCMQIAEQLSFTVADFLGESVAVLGIKGSGKSNTAAVLAEELMAAGVPMVIVDIAGEYYGLRERYDVLVVGKSDNVDLEITPEHAATLARFSIEEQHSVILDLSDFKKAERMAVLVNFFPALWESAGAARRPYQILLEEAHNWIPQSATTEVKDDLIRVATEGRKRGLGIIMVSQRAARIDKDVLTQAGIKFLHQVTYSTDLDSYTANIPPLLMAPAQVKQTVFGFQPGEALVLRGTQLTQAVIRKRHTFHAGYTPGMDAITPPELRKIDADVLSRLADLLTADEPESEATEDGRQSEAFENLKADLDTIGMGLLNGFGVGDDDLKTDEGRVFLATLRTWQEHVNSAIAQQIRDARPAPSNDAPPAPALPAAKQNGDAQIRVEPVAEGAAELFRSDLAIKRARGRQEQAFARLHGRVKNLPKHHRELMRLLADVGSQRRLSLNDAARLTGYSLSTLSSNPPVSLVTMGIIGRKKIAPGKWEYWWTGDSTLKRDYPDLDTDALVLQLIK